VSSEMSPIHPQAPEMAVAAPEPPQLQWYAVNTRSRHEKYVSRQLQGKFIEVFLPACTSLHRWNDRTAIVSQPLFPGYVFVRISASDRMQVLSVPGVVSFAGPRGRLCPIPNEELAALRVCLERRVRIEPHPYLVVGRRVRIRHGSLADLEGILVRKKGLFRLVLSVNLITRSVAAEVDASDVVPVGTSALAQPRRDKQFQ